MVRVDQVEEGAFEVRFEDGSRFTVAAPDADVALRRAYVRWEESRAYKARAAKEGGTIE